MKRILESIPPLMRHFSDNLEGVKDVFNFTLQLIHKMNCVGKESCRSRKPCEL
jgi:hypothetical protein